MANIIQKAIAGLSDRLNTYVEKGEFGGTSGTRGLIESIPQSSTDGAQTPVNYQTLYRIYKQESWVRACVDAIKRGATALGWELTPAVDDPDYKNEDRLMEFFDNPNPEDSMDEILEDVFTDLGIYANGYVEVVKGGDGLPKELWNLDATSMKVKHDEHGYVLGYKQTIGSKSVEFEADEVLHFRLVSKGATKYGMSPIETLIGTVDTDLKAQIYTRKYYENFGAPKGLFKMKNATPEQVRRNRLYLATQVAGIENAHRNLMLEGDVEYQTLGSEFKDTQSLQVRRFLRDEILAVYGVPPSKISIIESGNIGGGTGESQDKTFREETIYPLQNKVAVKITKKIIRQLFDIKDWDFEFIKPDEEDRVANAKVHDVYLKHNVLTTDEVREEIGYESKESAQEDEGSDAGAVSDTDADEGDDEPKTPAPKPDDTDTDTSLDPTKYDLTGKSLHEVVEYFQQRMNKNYLEVGGGFERSRTEFEKDFLTILKRKINRVVEAMDRYKKKKLKALSKPELDGLMASVELIFGEEELADNYEPSMEKMYAFSWEEAQRVLGVAANPVPEAIMAEVRSAALLLAKNVSDTIKGSIADAIIQAQNEGLGIPEMQGRIKEFLNKPLVINVPPRIENGKVIRAGYTRTLSADKWARLISRTESSNIGNRAILDQYKKYGVKQAKWLTSSNPCPYCATNGGRTFPIEDIDGLIPYHPNCVCSWTAVVE